MTSKVWRGRPRKEELLCKRHTTRQCKVDGTTIDKGTEFQRISKEKGLEGTRFKYVGECIQNAVSSRGDNPAKHPKDPPPPDKNHEEISGKNCNTCLFCFE